MTMPLGNKEEKSPVRKSMGGSDRSCPVVPWTWRPDSQFTKKNSAFLRIGPPRFAPN